MEAQNQYDICANCGDHIWRLDEKDYWKHSNTIYNYDSTKCFTLNELLADDKRSAVPRNAVETSAAANGV